MVIIPTFWGKSCTANRGGCKLVTDSTWPLPLLRLTESSETQCSKKPSASHSHEGLTPDCAMLTFGGTTAGGHLPASP